MSSSDYTPFPGPPTAPTPGYPVIVSATAPSQKHSGLTWMDTNTQVLKVWDGIRWVVTGARLPAAKQAGDVLVAQGAGDTWQAADGIDDGRF